MELTIEVPERVVERAAALGVPVETLVERALEGIGEDAFPAKFRLLRGEAAPRFTPAQAAAGIREIQSRNTLGGLKIRDLLEEGRH